MILTMIILLLVLFGGSQIIAGLLALFPVLWGLIALIISLPVLLVKKWKARR